MHGKWRLIMDKDPKRRNVEEIDDSKEDLMDRRGFLLGLKKWSKIVIGGALMGGALLNSATEKEVEAAGWANRAGGGGAWANKAGGGGAAWANRGGGAVAAPGGGAWANRAGGGGAWANRGAAWANRGASWVNRF
jgi:hypothetical protein